MQRDIQPGIDCNHAAFDHPRAAWDKESDFAKQESQAIASDQDPDIDGIACSPEKQVQGEDVKADIQQRAVFRGFGQTG